METSKMKILAVAIIVAVCGATSTANAKTLKAVSIKQDQHQKVEAKAKRGAAKAEAKAKREAAKAEAKVKPETLTSEAPPEPVASLADVINNPESPFTFNGELGKVTLNWSFSSDFYSVARLAVGGDSTTPYPANQNYDTVGDLMRAVFQIDTPFLGNAGQVDDASTIMEDGVAHFSSLTPFQYLAVHFGQHEVFFDFGQNLAAGTIFNIFTDGKAAGLSNFRAYSTIQAPPPSPVPVPAAVWLFGSGVAGLIGLGKRKKAKLSV